MSLRLKFVIAMLLASSVVAAAGAWQLRRLQEEAFATEARKRVELLADFGDAGRGYIWEQAARATMAHTDSLILETMSPAFAVRGLFDEFHKLAPEYLYRSPSLNPTRADDRATPLEAELIRRFDADRGLSELSGFATLNGQERFYVAKPIANEPGCLICHGPASAAPAVVTTRYGTAGGFDWPLDRIINALVIYVPTGDLAAYQRRTLAVAGGTFVASHALVLLLLLVLFYRLVDRRLRRVAAVMDEAAVAPGRPVAIADERPDEIGVVARAFNRMAASLVDAYQTLEQRVLERTRQLADAKAEAEAAHDEVRVQLRRLDRELKAARELQLGIVPHAFPPPTAARPVEVAAVMEPALEVGGDLYDVIELGEGRLCVVLGDVAGKGAAAALFMALTLSLVRSTARAARHGPAFAARLLEAVNEGLCVSNPSAMFVTMLAVTLDSRTGVLEIANAGHLPPWRLTPEGEVERVGPSGALPLGVEPDVRYATARANLGLDEVLFVCSDGITEARDGTGRMLGPEGVADTLARLAGRSPNEIVGALLAATRAFARDGTEPDDDLTALALRRVAG